MFCILRMQLLVKLISNFNICGEWVEHPTCNICSPRNASHLTQFHHRTTPVVPTCRTTTDLWPMQSQNRYKGSTVAVTQNRKLLQSTSPLIHCGTTRQKRSSITWGRAIACMLFLQFTYSHLTTCAGSEKKQIDAEWGTSQRAALPRSQPNTLLKCKLLKNAKSLQTRDPLCKRLLGLSQYAASSPPYGTAHSNTMGLL